MSEPDPPNKGEPASEADRTLLGVAPPRIETSVDSPLRSPVFVRSGTSVADVQPPPVPRMALPSRPPRAPGSDSAAVLLAGSTSSNDLSGGARHTALNGVARLARSHPALWMVAAPALLAASFVGALAATAPPPRAQPMPAGVTPSRERAGSGEPAAAATNSRRVELSALEGKSADSLSSSELLRLAQARSERQRESVKALQSKLEREPASASDKAVREQLLQAVSDPDTAPDALAAMTVLPGPTGADLLYEVWTGTSVRNETTELARALLYSTDVKAKASPALSVALELRAAESCEQYRAVLPKALTDGDRRAAHLLARLGARRGCGPKKVQDCYACLRGQKDELAATINAVKSRRPPLPAAP